MTIIDTEGKSPAELEARRREIVLSLTTQYKGYDDPDVPIELLRELALLTSTLRRKNAGPPKQRRLSNGVKKPAGTLEDLDF
jgi:hypothetical protein